MRTAYVRWGSVNGTRFLTLVVLLLLSTHAVAHPDHDDDEKSVVVGTVLGVRPQAIEVETLDRVALQLKTVLIHIDEETTFEEGKVSVEVLELARGDRVDCVVLISHAPDGSDRFRAAKIRRL